MSDSKMTPRKSVMPAALLVVLIGSVGALDAAAICVDPGSPTKCESTIQAGVDAAAAGDRVVVSKGTYYENVYVPAGKDGLTIKAKGQNHVVLDAGLPNTGAALLIQSSNVTIAGLNLRNGSDTGIVFEAGGDGGVVSNVTAEAFSKGCVWAIGGNYSITESTFSVCGCLYLLSEHEACTAVAIQGDNASVAHSTFTRSQQDAVQIFGSNGTVSGNDFSLIDFRAIWFSESSGDATANDNRFTDSDTGIRSAGPQLTATGNRGKRLNDELVSLYTFEECSGDTLIANNRVDGVSNDQGFAVSCREGVAPGATITIEDNVARNTEKEGVSVFADRAVVRNNKVVSGGMGIEHACYTLAGSGILATGNSGSRCAGGGLRSSGDAAEIRDNTFSRTGGSGVAILDGNAVVVTGNKSKRNLRFGFALGTSVTNAILSGNRAAGNREDLCDAGTGTVQTDNKFTTTIDPPMGANCVVLPD